MPKPKAPRWTIRGELPDFDPQAAPDTQLELFDEDMIQLVDPTGTYTVDVGWYPAGTRNGHFICRVVRAEDWERPFEQIETPSIKTVWKWLRHQIDAVNTRLGETGAFTPNVGLFIYPTARKKPHSKKRAKGPKTARVVPTYVRPTSTPAHNPTPLLSGEGPVPTTTNTSTSTAVAIGLGAELELAHAA